MRVILAVLLTSGMAFGQAADTPKAAAQAAAPSSTPTAEAATPPAQTDANAVVIPAGTRIPLLLKQAISTKNAREGDPVYAETAFPFVLDSRVLVPAGTYIQGKISHVE